MGKRTKKVGICGKYGTRYGASIRKNIKKIAGVKSITGRRSEANKGAFGGATTRAFSSTGQFAARGKSFSWTPAGVSIKKDGTRAVIKKKPYA